MSYSSSFSKSIFVVIFISDKIQQGMYEFLSTKMISEVLNIPKPTLVKILQSLNHAQIIETKEGKQGGVRLMKQPAEIRVLDILEAVEKGKPLFHTSFNLLAEGKRPDKAQESVECLLLGAEARMKQALREKTIADILAEMSQ